MCLMHGKHRIKFLRGVQQVIKLKKNRSPLQSQTEQKATFSSLSSLSLPVQVLRENGKPKFPQN